MKGLKKIIITVLMMFLFIGIKNANVDAANINIGDTKTGSTEYYGDKEYVLKLSRPMKVKITLTVGQSQSIDDDYLDDDDDLRYILFSLEDKEESEIIDAEVYEGETFTKTVKLKKGKYYINVYDDEYGYLQFEFRRCK